jgi:hypothetical protein
MQLAKHEVTITCPWCQAGSRMTFSDGKAEYCMACKKDLVTGKPMAAKPERLPRDARPIE